MQAERRQGALHPEARGAALPRDPVQHATRATWCWIPSSAPAPPARWRSSCTGTGSASSATRAYVALAAAPARSPRCACRPLTSTCSDSQPAPRPRMPFGALLEHGLLQPGDHAVSRRARADAPRASWPTARCESERSRGSIHQVARAQPAPRPVQRLAGLVLRRSANAASACPSTGCARRCASAVPFAALRAATPNEPEATRYGCSYTQKRWSLADLFPAIRQPRDGAAFRPN